MAVTAVANIRGGQPGFNPGPLNTYGAATNQRLGVYVQNWRGYGAWSNWLYDPDGFRSYTENFRPLAIDRTNYNVLMGRSRSINYPAAAAPIAMQQYALAQKTAQFGNYFATVPASQQGVSQ